MKRNLMDRLVFTREHTTSIPAYSPVIAKRLFKILKLKTPTHPGIILCWLLSQAEETNQVLVTGESIAKFNMELSDPIEERSFFRSVKELVEANVLLRLSGGRYLINPDVFEEEFKPAWKHTGSLEKKRVALNIHGHGKLKL